MYLGYQEVVVIVSFDIHAVNTFSFSLHRPSDDFKTLLNTWPAVWVTISSSWVCFILYAWTLWAPIALSNRDFD